MTASKSSGVVSSAGPWRAMPAELTTMSTAPRPENAARVASTSVMSSSCVSQLSPSAFIAACNSPNGPARRAAQTTCAPALAKAVAAPRPMPEVAPVTNARFPERSNPAKDGSCIKISYVNSGLLGRVAVACGFAIRHVLTAIAPHADIALFGVPHKAFQHA